MFLSVLGSFLSAILPDKEIYPVIPSEGERSDNKKCYSHRKVHQDYLLMNSGFSLILIFNEELLEKISTLDAPTGIHDGGNNFKSDQLGSLTKALEHLPLPKDGYYFYLEMVTNLALISDEYRVAMDTEIDNAIYVFNDYRTYIKFSCTNRNVSCTYI